MDSNSRNVEFVSGFKVQLGTKPVITSLTLRWCRWDCHGIVSQSSSKKHTPPDPPEGKLNNPHLRNHVASPTSNNSFTESVKELLDSTVSGSPQWNPHPRPNRCSWVGREEVSVTYTQGAQQIREVCTFNTISDKSQKCGNKTHFWIFLDFFAGIVDSKDFLFPAWFSVATGHVAAKGNLSAQI